MENSLIQVKENETVTTSLLIAEKFNKNHSHVLRDIKNLIAKLEENPILDAPRFFEKSEYITEQNKRATMYHVNRDGFTLLAMGFTGSEALKWKLKYIEAFNEMERRIKNPTLTDNRLEIARLILQAPESRVSAIKELYPEYFKLTPEIGTFEHIVELNTSYEKWINDYNVNREWLGYLPTVGIYNHYMTYCMENRLESMGKKLFYRTLEKDFGLTKKQKSNGSRYFIST